jgi:hypothetical protein
VTDYRSIIGLSNSVAQQRKQERNWTVTVRQAIPSGDRPQWIRIPERSQLIRAAILLVSFAILVIAYRVVERTIAFNSDNACILLQAHEVAGGNLALRGWALSNCSFYPEISFYAVAMLINHSPSALSRELPPIVYALIVMFALWLTGLGSGNPPSYAGYAITFILIGLPTNLQHLYIAPGTHMSTMLLIFAALVALSFTEETSARAPAAYIAYTALLAFAVFGDLFALYFAAIPIALVTAYRWVRGLFSQTRELIALAATVAAVLIADGAIRLIRAIGGFRLVPVEPHFVALKALHSNISATIGGITSLCGIDPAQAASPLGAILFLARSAGLAFILGCCIYSAYRSLRGTETRTTAIVTASALVTAIGYLSNNAVIGLTTARYLIPFVLYGAILAGRVAGTVIRPTKLFYAAIGLISVAYLFGFVRLMSQPTAIPQREETLAQWLYQRGLVLGYGDYWHASIVTLESDGKVKIRAISFAGRLYPYLWESKSEWYSGDPGTPAPNFVVIEEQKKMLAFHEAISAMLTLGRPSKAYQFEGYTIMVWDKGKWLLRSTPNSN